MALLKSKRLFIGLALIGVLVAAACGGGGDTSSQPSTAPTATPGFAPLPTPTSIPSESGALASTPLAATAGSDPLAGGEFTRLFGDPPTLDPALTSDTTSAALVVEIYSGLVSIDTDLNIIPDIAESWDVTNDGRTYTFYLRKDVKFHDGKPVTAHDFKYSMERTLNPATESTVADLYLNDIVGAKAMLNGTASSVNGIRVLDDYTLEITIDAAKPYFLAKLTYPTAFVVDKENVESGADWTSRPNGTGPFKMVKWEIGESIRFERNELFYNGPPHLDAVNFILSGGVGMTMYENNEIDFTGVGLADIDRVLDPTEELNRDLNISPPDYSISYIGLNTQMAPFDDIKVRQALNLAINKELIADAVLSNLVTPAYGILPPGFPGFNQNLEGLHYDPEKAMRLMAESSYGQGDPEITELLLQADMTSDPDQRVLLLSQASAKAAANLPTIILSVPGGGGAVGLDTEVVLEMWRRFLGVDVEIQQSEFATFLNDLDRRRYQMFTLGWVADYPDPQDFLDILFHSESSNNHTGYTNPEVDRLLEQARTEADVETRIALYQQAEQIIVNESPWIPKWYEGDRYVLIKSHVKNYILTPLIVPKLKNIYLEPQ
ncbi:MAG: peptide ABC transporter substrate-binding protein [Chloroflexi bacterium]|nr:peptide ABC transporter substrate-binding protein [Chloroflexota bacterium]